MRKFTLLLVALFITATTFAQRSVSNKHLTSPDGNSRWVIAPLPAPVNDDAILTEKLPYTSSSVRESETIIGTTVYDVQTNRAIHNRLIRNSDGTLSAAWTTSCDATGSWADRGTGYNYFDGTSWLPSDCHRIEPLSRTGFVNIGVTASGKEFSIGHSSTATGMLITSRTTKGTGAWTEDPAVLGGNDNDLWAQTAVGGPDGKTIHAIWQASGATVTVEQCGQKGAVVYSRSTDDGVTWPVLHQCLDLIDSSSYIGFSACDYSIAAQGTNVAILISEFQTDLILLRSTDNGDNWTKTILWQFPIPFYDEATMVIDTNEDGTPDIIPVPDGDGRVYFDKNGIIHVVYSEVFIGDDTESALVGYYPDADGGLFYWNENMFESAPALIDSARDLNGDGILNYPLGDPGGAYYGSGTYGAGLTMQPTMGFDEANNMYIAYSTYDELSDTSAYGAGHRHVYVKSSYDGGATWSDPFDVVPSLEEGGDGENQECVYPCMASTVDGLIHITYQRDPAPGTSLTTTTDEGGWNVYTNDIVYVAVGPGELVGTPTVKSNFFSVSQNTPNPFNDQTQFSITLDKQSAVSLRVTNILGQEVYSENTNYAAGNHVYNFNRGDLTAGIYNFTVEAQGEKISKKIIVE